MFKNVKYDKALKKQLWQIILFPLQAGDVHGSTFTNVIVLVKNI